MIQLWLLLAVSFAVLHGLVYVLDRFLLKNKEIETMSFSTFRYVINAFISFGFALIISGITFPTDPNFWIYLVIIVAAYVTAGLAYFHMLKHGDASKTVPIGQSANTLLAFVLALVILTEKTTLYDVAGTALIALGGYMILTNGKIIFPKISKEIFLAIMWGLLLSVFGVVSKPATDFVQPPVLNVFLYSLSGLSFFVMTYFSSREGMEKTANVLWKNKKLLGLMALSSLIATSGTLILFFALSLGKASEVLPVSRSLPLFTALLGWLLLKEKHGKIRVLAAAIIVLGIYLIYL